MSVTDIENAIAQLGPVELSALRRWFAAFDAVAWDRQIAADAADGRLDSLVSEAQLDYASGRAREF